MAVPTIAIDTWIVVLKSLIGCYLHHFGADRQTAITAIKQIAAGPLQDSARVDHDAGREALAVLLATAMGQLVKLADVELIAFNKTLRFLQSSYGSVGGKELEESRKLWDRAGAKFDP